MAILIQCLALRSYLSAGVTQFVMLFAAQVVFVTAAFSVFLQGSFLTLIKTQTLLELGSPACAHSAAGCHGF